MDASLRLTIPSLTQVILLDGTNASIKYCHKAQVAVYQDKEPYPVFAELSVLGMSKSTELVKIRLLDGEVLLVPRRTPVLMDRAGIVTQFGEGLSVGNVPTNSDWKNTLPHQEQRKWNNQWQIIDVAGKPLRGSDTLKSWTMGVSQVVREVSIVEGEWEMVDVEIASPAIALAIVGHRPGMINQTDGVFEKLDPEGILITEKF